MPIVLVRKRVTGGGPSPVAPTNTVAPAVTGTAKVGSLLSTTDGTWTGDPVITFTYQWQRGGVDIGGATANTYTLVDADDALNVRCVVTGTNGAGSSSANSNAVAVTEPVPTNSVAPAVTGTTGLGDVLTSTTGTWAHMGGTVATYAYQWQRDSVDIGGQTASTHTIVSADQGHNVRCVVTATNTGGAGTPANSNQVAVPAATYAQTVLADSPGGYWRCGDASGTLVDSSGNGHDLATVASITYGTASLISTDAANKSITVAGTGYAGTASYTPNTPPFTIEGWVKHTSSGVYQRFAAVHNAWQAGISSANKWTLTAAGVADYEFAATSTVNVVYYVAFVFDTSQDVSLYINGVFSETVTGTTNPNAGDKFVIGAKDTLTGNENWIGIIDEVAFYPVALSAGRIAAHFAAA